jgi:hypothetical protein
VRWTFLKGWAVAVVFPPVGFDDDLCHREGLEGFAAQEFIPQLPIERLDTSRSAKESRARPVVSAPIS